MLIAYPLLNFLLIPAATKLEQRSKRETLKTNLIIETLVSISQNEHPRLLQERLLGFLPPKERRVAIPGKKSKKAPVAAKKAVKSA